MQFAKYFVTICLLAVQYSFQDSSSHSLSSSSSSSSEEGSIEVVTTEGAPFFEELPETATVTGPMQIVTTQEPPLSEQTTSFDVATPRSRFISSYLSKILDSGREKTYELLKKSQELRKILQEKRGYNYNDRREKRSVFSKVMNVAKKSGKKLTNEIKNKLLRKLF